MGERLAFTFALTGRRFGFYVTQGVALGLELAGLSARAWPLTIGLWTCWAFAFSPRWAFTPRLARAWPPQSSPPHFASKVSYSASPQTFAHKKTARQIRLLPIILVISFNNKKTVDTH